MWTLMRNGGFPMFFVLGFGLVALASAIRFAWRPTPARLRVTDSLGRATRYSSVVALFAALTNVCFAVAKQSEGRPLPFPWDLLFAGLGESTSAVILGFTFAALVALFSAVGSHRLEP